jgi:DNA helicase HerA-like ATPase
MRIGERELRLIFDVAGASTINIGHLQQDRSIGAYVDAEEMVQKHFAIFASTGSGKSSAVALILREIMAAQMNLRVLLMIRTMNTRRASATAPTCCVPARCGCRTGCSPSMSSSR